MTKGELRGRMERLLRGIDAADLARRSEMVAKLLQETPAWKQARIILCFLSMPHELDTAALIACAKRSARRVAVPRIENDVIRFVFLPGDRGELPRDRWGIPVPRADWEPFSLRPGARILAAVPGLAFDRSGNRLGRGKGFYDRFLKEARGALDGELTAVGICLSEQLVDEVPHGERDQRLDGVVTERESIVAS
ncbi:MAG TPA: 5-formyltetrahydrofolate cyclo-ligase [Spirochaetia bacterium]|nr:5-formyltetrahydrofolate cyclo-ligase [Spirochaetia bacterium]